MKKIITIIVFAVATQLASAHGQGSVLNIRLSNNQPFKVFVDGYRAEGVSNRAKLTNLSDGRHLLEVYRIDNNRGRGRMRNAFSGYVTINCNTESFATIDLDCNKIQIDRVVALNQPDWMDRDNRNICFYPKPQVNHFPKPYENALPAGPMPMCAADFTQLKNTIYNAGFESTKLNIFKQALSFNYFTTVQVRELMNLFWFESSKLEVAKLAYPKTLDRNNYYMVNNEFTFSSSVNELGEYVAMR